MINKMYIDTDCDSYHIYQQFNQREHSSRFIYKSNL